jgi:hypothetical protein
VKTAASTKRPMYVQTNKGTYLSSGFTEHLNVWLTDVLQCAQAKMIEASVKLQMSRQ